MAKKEIIIPETRDFKGVWTPRKLYLARNLSTSKKNMLVEIYSLTKNDSRKCFASNRHFSDFLGLKENTVKKMMSDLEKDGYINRFYKYVGNTREIESRTIQLTNKFYKEFINEYENNESENGSESNGKKSTPLVDLSSGEGGGIKSTISNTNILSNTDLRDTPNSFSNEKDNSKPNGLELHNSQVGELGTPTPEPREDISPKTKSNVTMTLGRKERPSRKHELQDMPTRAKEIAYELEKSKELADKAFDLVQYFMDKYKKHSRHEHLNLRNDTLERVVRTMLSTITVEVGGKDGDYFENDYTPLICYEVDREGFKEVIDKYFATKFDYEIDGKRVSVDYSIVHFTDENVLPKIMNKCMLNGDNWYENHVPY